jgi:hypothetical protein
MTRLTLPVLLTSTLAYAQPPRPIEVAPIVPVEWRLLSQSTVRDDLGLTNEQKTALERVEAWQAIPYAALFWGTRGACTPEMANSFKEQARDEYLTKTLMPAQRTRLRQIEYQLKEREFGAHLALAMAARQLGLCADQLEDVTSIKGQRVEEIAKLVTSGERFDKVKPKVESANTDTYEKIAEMLTKTQRERLKELRGGRTFERKLKVKSNANDEAGPAYPAQLFGVYDFELRYLRMDEVRTELKVTAEQGAELDKARFQWIEKLPNHMRLDKTNPQSILELHELIASAITKTLSKDQIVRLGQISMQVRALVSQEAMCGHPAAVTALKLTPIQLAEFASGKRIAEVLTREQRDAREQLLGPPFAALTAMQNPFLPQSRTPSNTFLAAFASRFLVISDRLKLTEEQIKKLRELAEDEPKFFELLQRELGFADTAPVAGAGRAITPAGIVSDQFRESVEEQCWNVLDDKQKSTAKAIYGRRK